MGAQQPPPDRPNTLGQAWRRMGEPRPYRPRDLPTLPDWPPLPDEPPQPSRLSPSAWPALGSEAPETSHLDDARQPTTRDDTLWPGQSWAPAATPAATPRQPRRGSPLRWLRRAPKRTQIGITAAAVVVLVVLIVACSSFALRTTAGLVAPRSQGATNHSGTPSSPATLTAHPTSQPTPTSAPLPPLTLAFTCASGRIRATGQVCVHTLPAATLSLSVRYCDGSTAKGLHGSVTADGSGNYTWSWPVHPTCVGPATATVTARANGQSLTASDTFTISG